MPRTARLAIRALMVVAVVIAIIILTIVLAGCSPLRTYYRFSLAAEMQQADAAPPPVIPPHTEPVP